MAGFLSKLFGGGGSSDGGAVGDPVDHKGYQIIAAPKQEGSQWLTAGTISKEVDGETKSHEFIRADRHGDRDSAAEFSLNKGKQIVDEQGDSMFRER